MAVNFPRTPADAPVVPPDVPCCTDCGCDWIEHRRVGEYPYYEYRCPEPPEGRWVGTWPEEVDD